MKYTLEVIAFSIESCRIAQYAGAQRIELCANPMEGGTTPSAGMIRKAREATTIQLFPIIRPRGGDFLYTDTEFEIMKEDILVAKDAGCDGVVIGLLTDDGSIDMERTSKLVELSRPMKVTFHRAFDRVKDPITALEAVITCGCNRILTSGLHPTVSEGRDTLKQLVKLAGDRIIIMPGSGVRSSNIEELISYTGAVEFHSSARIEKSSEMMYTNGSMNEVLTHTTLDGQEVWLMRKILDQASS
jgi:copper homeostasis protein